MAASKAILHATWDSSCVYRVRICLSFKGIPYDIKPIKKTKTGYEIKVDDRDLNPTNLVPVLQIDGHSLIESVAIMEYLEETRPEPALLPKDFHKRAQVRAFCDIIMSGIQPMQNSGPLRLVSKYTDGNEMEWIHHWINKGFAALEKLLLSHAGKYCVGDEITLADCCLVPMVLNARRFAIFD